MAELTLAVDGMTCGHCTSAVATALEAVPGVGRVSVDLVAGTATLDADAAVDRAAIASAIDEAGYRLVDA